MNQPTNPAQTAASPTSRLWNVVRWVALALCLSLLSAGPVQLVDFWPGGQTQAVQQGTAHAPPPAKHIIRRSVEPMK